MCKVRIGVIFGGRSEEHDVSLKSAATVIKALDSDKFVPIYIGITRQGRWKLYRGHGDIEEAAVKIADGSWEAEATDFNPGDLKASADFVFPILHGPYGEDGCIQGFLETLQLPYAGCGVLTSALSMDKQMFKELMQEKGLPVCRYLCLRRKDVSKGLEEACRRVIRAVGLPCFVKPANMGSSVGISRAKDEETLKEAIKTAFDFDDKIVAEEALEVRELEIAALGEEDPRLSAIGEIVPSEEFYDYRAKYGKIGEGCGNGKELLSAASGLLIPAGIEPEQERQIRQLATRAYEAVEGYGFSRIDFFCDKKTGRIYINEINTIPGFTAVSMFPLLWQAEGLSPRQIIERIIDLGYERYYAKNNR